MDMTLCSFGLLLKDVVLAVVCGRPWSCEHHAHMLSLSSRFSL